MTRVSVGDASLANLLARQGAQLRAGVNRAAAEIASGRPTDIGQALRGDLSPLLALDASLTRLKAYARNTGEAGLYAASQQAAISGLSSLASALGSTIVRSKDLVTPAQVDVFGSDARGRLASAVGMLNAQPAGRAVFSGTASGTLPLGAAEDMLDALQTAAAGATTASQVASAVADWFSSATGYGAFYQGAGPLTSPPIAPGETADLSVTANDPVIKETLMGFALGALLDRGVLFGVPEERADLAQRAGETLQRSQDGRITLAARIGTVEAQIEAAATRNSAEETALGILRSEQGSVDPYEAATRLEELKSQLESLYLITARVSRLSLVDFLR
jgi:flagellar hook-associated protein 3 FlgL